MAISSQLPQVISGLRVGALQALALQAGQVVEATVIGAAPNGGTQVQINGQVLNLVLPTLVAAGTTLRLAVQGSGAQAKLAIQPQTGLPNLATAPQLPLPTAPAAGLVMPGFANQPASSPSGSTAPTPIPAAAASPVGQSVASANPASAASAAATPAGPVPASIATIPQTPPTGTTATTALSPGLLAPVSGVAQGATGGQAPAANPYMRTMAPSLPAAPAAVVSAPLSPAGTPMPGAVPVVASQAPTTPQAAVAQMVQAALPRQDGANNLMSALASVVGKIALPEPVLRAATQVLAGRMALDGGLLDGSALQKAVQNAGVFQEAMLARGQIPNDMKSSLLGLQQALGQWLGRQPPLTPAGQIVPPMRGQVARAKAVDGPPIDPDAAAEDIGKQLLERTEGALARVRLHQHASLPDPQAKTAMDWSMDLPVTMGQQQSLLHIQIHRDEHAEVSTPTERGWQMRFALSVPDLGEVGAQVSLRGGATGVMLWASDPESAARLEDYVGALRQTLSDVGLRPGAVIVRHGEPPTAGPAASGHVLDAVR